MKYIVYMHKTPSGKIYIGITSKEKLNDRWRNGQGYHHNRYFTSAVNKYGWENIEHKILYDNLTEEEAKTKEIELIKKYKTNNRKYGYNQSLGGESSKGYKHTPEQIEKQIKNRKKPIYTKETRMKFSRSAKEVWQRPGYREMMSKKAKERPHPKGYKFTPEQIEHLKATRKRKPVMCVETGIIYESSRYIEKELGLSRRSIMRCCKGQAKTCGGYHWKHYTED